MSRTPQAVWDALAARPAVDDTPAPVLVLLDIGILRDATPEPVQPC